MLRIIVSERRPIGYVKVYEPPETRREEEDFDMDEGHDYDYRHVAKEMTPFPSNHTVSSFSVSSLAT